MIRKKKKRKKEKKKEVSNDKKSLITEFERVPLPSPTTRKTPHEDWTDFQPSFNRFHNFFVVENKIKLH